MVPTSVITSLEPMLVFFEITSATEPTSIVPAPLTREFIITPPDFPYPTNLLDILYAFADVDPSTGTISLTDSYADEQVTNNI